MMVEPAGDTRLWEAFQADVQPPTFLQSWAWGESQQSLGEKVIRLQAVEQGQIVGIAQAVTVTARRAQFLHVPHGPILSGARHSSPHQSTLGTKQTVGSRDGARLLLEALREEARRRGLAFLRVSPIQADTEENRSLYAALGFRRAPIHVHADRLWALDLSPSENKLLAAMRKTTRNLIRRAERDGVTVRLSQSPEDLPVFLSLYEETAARERFVPFSRRALEAEFRAFAAQSSIALATAWYHGEPLATAMIPLAPWSAFYHHGASSRLRPHTPAAYAVQWAVIREAKRRGCREYNFWGIASASDPWHPWQGLTLFKTGFGGREVPLVPTQDLPLSLRYALPFAVDTVRRWRRRL